MQKQVYRFQLHDEVSPDIWEALDEADQSRLWIVKISFDPNQQESQSTASKQIAGEHNRECFSADENFYITCGTLEQARELRSQLVARGVVAAPAKVAPSSPDRTVNVLGWAGIAAVMIVTMVAAGRGLGWWRSRAATPVLSPVEGSFSSPQPVLLSDATPGATIRYTLGGSQPTNTSPAYTGPLTGLPSGTRIRAIATAPGYTDSFEAAGAYLWSAPAPAEPGPQSQAYRSGKQNFDDHLYSGARRFFTQSCKAGEAVGCSYLAYLYAEGLGGPRDIPQAFNIYRPSCDKGNLTSCSNLGFLYEKTNNNAEARGYFEKACNGGIDEACQQLKKTHKEERKF